MTRDVAPGVRLHLVRTSRFTTTYCRIVMYRDLGPEATATAVLAPVLQSATARYPTRTALAHRLADLYGAALQVVVGKIGDRQTLTGSLEWPTEHVPRAGGMLSRGLRLLREVWSDPKRAGRGEALDPEIVRAEQVNHVRALRSLKNDKARYALRRCLASVCADEPFGLDAHGCEEDVAAADGAALADLHRRLLASAPAEIFLVGDLGLREALGAVREHLLWPGRAARPARVRQATAVRPARARPRRLVETDRVVQGKLVFGFRAPIRPTAALAPAIETLTGVLGGGSYARLFKVAREKHGLCYYASAGWYRPKGVLVVQTGIDAAYEARARRVVRGLVREVAGGDLDDEAWHAYLQEIRHRVAALRDSPHGMVSWYQERLALGLDPSPESFLEGLEAVTPAAVRRAGRRLALDTTFCLRPAEAVS